MASLILSRLISLLTLGGLAVFIASRGGNTQNTKLNVINEITNNSYFTPHDAG